MRVLMACLLLPMHSLTGQPALDFTTPPHVIWTFATGGPIVSSAVIGEGRVYVGSTDSVLYALDLATGTPRWTVRIGGPVRSTVCLGPDGLFLSGGDGIVRCLEKNSGKELWHFATQGEKVYELYGYADYFHSSPALFEHVLIVGSGDGSVYALNSSTGDIRWRVQTGNVVHSSPVIDSDRVFIGSFDGNVYALRLADGLLLWTFKAVGHRFFPRGEFQGSPVIGNGLVYIGSRDYNVYAIDREKGYCHWNRQFPLGWAMALSCPDTTLYIGTSDDDLLVAVDGRTGREFWRTDIEFNMFGPPSVTAGMLYAGTLMGKMYGLDRRTGSIRWSFATDGYTAHHRKYFPSEETIVKNDFYSIVQTPEGYIRALYELGAIFSTPAISGNRMVITSTDGTVYCLSR